MEPVDLAGPPRDRCGGSRCSRLVCRRRGSELDLRAGDIETERGASGSRGLHANREQVTTGAASANEVPAGAFTRALAGLALNWDDVDLDARTITINKQVVGSAGVPKGVEPTKTHDHRVAQMPDWLVLVLTE